MLNLCKYIIFLFENYAKEIRSGEYKEQKEKI